MIAVIFVVIEIILAIVVALTALVNIAGPDLSQKIIRSQINSYTSDKYFENGHPFYCQLKAAQDFSLQSNPSQKFNLEKKPDFVNALTSILYHANMSGSESFTFTHEKYGEIKTDVYLRPDDSNLNNYLLRTFSGIGRKDPFLSIPDKALVAIKFSKPLSLGLGIEVSDLAITLDSNEQGLINYYKKIKSGKPQVLTGLVFLKNQGVARVAFSFNKNQELNIKIDFHRPLRVFDSSDSEVPSVSLKQIEISYVPKKSVDFKFKLKEDENPIEGIAAYDFSKKVLDTEFSRPLEYQGVYVLDLRVDNLGYNQKSKIEFQYRVENQEIQVKEFWFVVGDSRVTPSETKNIEIRFSTSPDEVELFKDIENPVRGDQC